MEGKSIMGLCTDKKTWQQKGLLVLGTEKVAAANVRLLSSFKPVVPEDIYIKPINIIVGGDADITAGIPLALSGLCQPGQCQYTKVSHIHRPVAIEVSDVTKLIDTHVHGVRAVTIGIYEPWVAVEVRDTFRN